LSARLENVNINVTKTTDTGTALITGILSNGTGTPTILTNNLIDVTCIISSTGTGRNVALTTTTAVNSINALNSTFAVTTTTGICYGVESNVALSIITLNNCQCFAGTTTLVPNISDISQTLGIIRLNNTNLINSTANGLSFSILNSYKSLIFGLGATNSITNGTVNFYMGNNTTTTASGTNYDYVINTPMIITNMYYKVNTLGTGNHVFAILKNGIETLLTLNNSSLLTTQSTNNISVNFQPGDLLSLKSYRTTGTSPQGIRFILTIY
jgi:hypothetical protein